MSYVMVAAESLPILHMSLQKFSGSPAIISFHSYDN